MTNTVLLETVASDDDSVTVRATWDGRTFERTYTWDDCYGFGLGEESADSIPRWIGLHLDAQVSYGGRGKSRTLEVSE